MFPTLKTIAATGGVLLGAATPAFTQDPSTNFGPVGPGEPILASLGGQRVIAFFVPERGSCAVNAIIWKDGQADAPYASSRVKVSLRPGEMVQFDEARTSMKLLCGAEATTLAAVGQSRERPHEARQAGAERLPRRAVPARDGTHAERRRPARDEVAVGHDADRPQIAEQRLAAGSERRPRAARPASQGLGPAVVRLEGRDQVAVRGQGGRERPDDRQPGRALEDDDHARRQRPV